MFKKLKNKFIFMNMVLLTTVFVGIFGTIYVSTAYSLNNDMKMQLWNSIMEPQQQKPTPKDNKMDMTIKIDLDTKNEIVNVTSRLNTDDLDINGIIEKVINNSKEMDSIKIDGESYAYLKESISSGTIIVLMSKSFQQDVLGNLLKIFLIVGSLSLIVLFIISIYFTNKAIKPLEETFIKQKQFIADASHELRTPLNIIINATNLLKIKLNEKECDKSFFHERLDYIMKNANRLRRYINNLIDVSKLEMGYMDARFTNENIVSVVEDITLTIVDLAKSYNLNVVFDTEEEEIIMAIDKIKIERIILNLLSNAIKFTNDNGNIMVLIKREEDNVVIEISDDGIGMAEEVKDHVFEKFKRADFNDGFNRKNEGSGLGLFIVRGLIDLHNGKISVNSKPNEGTKFIITLPIRIVEDEENENFMEYSSLEYMFEMEFSDIERKE